MSIAVRQADLRDDREQLIHFCRENLPIHPDAQRFDWLYLNNPFGAARTLIATQGGEMIGLASAFPRQLWAQGKRRRAWILGDFCITERFRTLGPALTLQRACLASLPADELWYDFPSRTMLAVYRRLGVPLFTQQTRHVRLLKIDRKLGKAGGYLVEGIGSFGSWRTRRSFRSSREIECAEYDGVFGKEFADLDNDPNTHRFVRGARTPEYLNWRYRSKPSANGKVITARRERKLMGYVVVQIDSEATILDILVVEEAVLPVLLAHLIRTLLKTNAARLNASILNESALSTSLKRAGFVAREAAPVVVHGCDNAKLPDLYQARNWLLLHGDRES